jgi:hypothetical protein
VDGDLSVNKLVFLSRDFLMHKSSAHLVASGPYGMIHFWSVFNGNQLFARFKVVSLIFFIPAILQSFFIAFNSKSKRKGAHVLQMFIDSKYENLFAADKHGYIYHWNIAGYASKRKEFDPPIRTSALAAHRHFSLKKKSTKKC